MGLHWQGGARLLVAGVLVAAALVVASLLLLPDPPARMALPTAGELVELESYLVPGPEGEGIGAGLPAPVAVGPSPFGVEAPVVAVAEGPAPERDRESGPAAPAVPKPAWTLSAVMITGGRRVAIVNDRLVRVGDALGGGARVESVERDHIVIITASGERRRLDLEG